MFNSETIALFGISAYPPTTTVCEDGTIGGHGGVIHDLAPYFRVWVVPAFSHPWRSELSSQTFPHRFRMTQEMVSDLALENPERVEVKNLEEDLYIPDTPIPTYLTLRYARTLPEAAGSSVVCVVGSDHCQGEGSDPTGKLLPGWENREEIIAGGLVIVPRPNNPIDPAGLPDSVFVLDRIPRNGNSGVPRAILSGLREDFSNAEEIYLALLWYVSPHVALDMIANPGIFR